MKRDMELVRTLLLYFEDKPSDRVIQVAEIDGYDAATIKYHQVLLYDAGLLNCEPIKTERGRLLDVWPSELSWQGHEFLDKVRAPFIWDEVKREIESKGLVTASLDILKALADKAIRKKMELE